MNETVFRFSASVLLIPVGVAIVALLAGIVLMRRKETRHTGIVALFVTLLAGGVFAPAMYCDRVIVTPQKIEQRTGFPTAPKIKGFAFGDVKYVHIGSRQSDIGPREEWQVFYRDGSMENIDPGDLWEKNSFRIVPLLKKYGVQFR
jgi:hypothetical protein